MSPSSAPSNAKVNRLTVVALALCALVAPAAQAQTYKVLHNFGLAPSEGANPEAGLTIDGTGNLFGTTSSGGLGFGTVFEMKRAGSSFVYRPLYSFKGGDDGDTPEARVTIGPDGALYGTTVFGGGKNPPYNNGTVFKLQPPPTFCKAVSCPWLETVLLAFNEANGSTPYSEVTFDQAGSLYGTAYGGGQHDEGDVFKLTPSGGGWTFSFVYSFSGGADGRDPVQGVIFDSAGNLYGTTRFGTGNGSVFQLTPSGQSWTESTLYSFTAYGNDGGWPETGVIMDSAGNIYGTTPWLGYTNNPGTVYELTPSGGGWTYSLLYGFPTGWDQGAGYVSQLLMDKDGNLYGTTSEQGLVASDCPFGCGTVFKLTRSNGGYTYSMLYEFTGGTDGGAPYSGVVLDAQGNLYGTTWLGGTGTNCDTSGCGVVWEITP